MMVQEEEDCLHSAREPFGGQRREASRGAAVERRWAAKVLGAPAASDRSARCSSRILDRRLIWGRDFGVNLGLSSAMSDLMASLSAAATLLDRANSRMKASWSGVPSSLRSLRRGEESACECVESCRDLQGAQRSVDVGDLGKGLHLGVVLGCLNG